MTFLRVESFCNYFSVETGVKVLSIVKNLVGWILLIIGVGCKCGAVYGLKEPQLIGNLLVALGTGQLFTSLTVFIVAYRGHAPLRFICFIKYAVCIQFFYLVVVSVIFTVQVCAPPDEVPDSLLRIIVPTSSVFIAALEAYAFVLVMSDFE